MVDSASIRWFENVNDADRLSSRLLDKVSIVPLQMAICVCAESNRFEKSAIAPASLSCCALSPRFITISEMTNTVQAKARAMDKYVFHTASSAIK